MPAPNVVSLLHRPHRSSALREFAERWFDEESVLWRRSTIATRKSLMNAHILPAVDGLGIEGFSRADAMALRAALARGQIPSGRTRSAKQVNAILRLLGRMLAERERQHGVPNPCVELRRIPEQRTDIRPFSLPELATLCAHAPNHLADYIWIRGLTGLRSGESNGLRWRDIDLKNGVFNIQVTRVNRADQPPKNQYSERRIKMLPSVREAFLRQLERTKGSETVFATPRGKPIDSRDFAKRDWRTLLSAARLPHRSPEQLRHTAATLMLAAGEAPTYIARVLGHADTRQLLTTYARFMPDALGRIDGSHMQAAIDGLVVHA